jgi:hypothetical protein
MRFAMTLVKETRAVRTPDELKSDLCNVEDGTQVFKRGVPRPDCSAVNRAEALIDSRSRAIVVITPR